MSSRKKSSSSHNAIGSQVSECGLMHFVQPDGTIHDMYGQAVARASLSARQAKEMGLLTSGTCGRRGTISSQSAALQSYLANRLEEKTALLGSILYKLIWKGWATPAGRLFRLLRASARRTSENGFTGMPTPTCRDYRDGSAKSCKNVPSKSILGRHVHKIGVPTPKASDGMGGRKRKGQTAGGDSHLQLEPRQMDFGQVQNGYPELTDSGAPLNPDYSRWLMGLPTAWSSCAPMETPSVLRKRKHS